MIISLKQSKESKFTAAPVANIYHLIGFRDSGLDKDLDQCVFHPLHFNLMSTCILHPYLKYQIAKT